MRGLSLYRPIVVRRHLTGGFTLVELVVTLVLSVIVVGFAVMFLAAPADIYSAQSRRSQLVDSSDAITRRMAADLRRALPNSVRIRNAGTRSIVELLLVDKFAFYRDAGLAPNAADNLKIGVPENAFAALGQFFPGVSYPPSLTLKDNYHLAIGNRGIGVGAGGRNAYRLANVITPNNVRITLNDSGTAGEDLVTLNPAFQFAATSDTNRVFLVSTPVAYICNSAANSRTLRRDENYAITAAIPTAETSAQLNAPGVVNTIVATDISRCRLRCDAGSTMPCNKALVIDMNVSQTGNAANEIVRVFAQLPVEDKT